MKLTIFIKKSNNDQCEKVYLNHFCYQLCITESSEPKVRNTRHIYNTRSFDFNSNCHYIGTTHYLLLTTYQVVIIM